MKSIKLWSQKCQKVGPGVTFWRVDTFPLWTLFEWTLFWVLFGPFLEGRIPCAFKFKEVQKWSVFDVFGVSISMCHFLGSFPGICYSLLPKKVKIFCIWGSKVQSSFLNTFRVTFFDYFWYFLNYGLSCRCGKSVLILVLFATFLLFVTFLPSFWFFFDQIKNTNTTWFTYNFCHVFWMFFRSFLGLKLQKVESGHFFDQK